MVDSVEDFECLSSDQLVIPVDNEEHLAIVTIFMDSIVNILKGSPMLLGGYEYVSLWVCVPPFEVIGCVLYSTILRAVVDNDDFQVGVFLLKNGLNAPNVSEVFHIVVGRHDNASRQLLVLTYFVLLLIGVSLFCLHL